MFEPQRSQPAGEECMNGEAVRLMDIRLRFGIKIDSYRNYIVSLSRRELFSTDGLC